MNQWAETMSLRPIYIVYGFELMKKDLMRLTQHDLNRR